MDWTLLADSGMALTTGGLLFSCLALSIAVLPWSTVDLSTSWRAASALRELPGVAMRSVTAAMGQMRAVMGPEPTELRASAAARGA
jgi:hypothetical protein